jgi:hypothetical protein
VSAEYHWGFIRNVVVAHTRRSYASPAAAAGSYSGGAGDLVDMPGGSDMVWPTPSLRRNREVSTDSKPEACTRRQWQ